MDLVAGYGESQILHGVHLRLGADEIVCIVGPNGAGKSTLLKAVFGLLTIHGGRVECFGQDVTGRAPHELVDAGLAYVPQLDNVFPNLTVRENLEMGAFRADAAGRDAALERVGRLFPVLAERPRERCGRLSGGQRQMVAMARALMMQPRALLLDEPSAGLSPQLVEEVFAQVRTIADAGIPVLLVEQNAKHALALADRGYVLDAGRNRYEGSGADLLKDENVGRLYLGE